MSKLFSKNHQQTTLEETQEDHNNTSYDVLFSFVCPFLQKDWQIGRKIHLGKQRGKK